MWVIFNTKLTSFRFQPAIKTMKTYPFLLLVAGLLLPGCGKKEAAQPETSSSGNPVTAPVDYLGAVAKAKKSTEKTVETVGLQKTIDLFQAQEGRLPKNLNELVGPNYLSALPAPPAGMKFDYSPTTGQLKIVPQ